MTAALVPVVQGSLLVPEEPPPPPQQGRDVVHLFPFKEAGGGQRLPDPCQVPPSVIVPPAISAVMVPSLSKATLGVVPLMPA